MSIKEEPRRTLFVKYLEIPYVIHRFLQIPTRYINRSPKEMIEGRISAEKPRQISALVNLVWGRNTGEIGFSEVLSGFIDVVFSLANGGEVGQVTDYQR